jgi:hypothetical protein
LLYIFGDSGKWCFYLISSFKVSGISIYKSFLAGITGGFSLLMSLTSGYLSIGGFSKDFKEFVSLDKCKLGTMGGFLEATGSTFFSSSSVYF